MATKTLHIATLNVHAAFGNLRRQIGDVLRGLDLDVVCLQECSPGTADALCSMLGPSWRVAVAPAAYLANVILSAHPIRKKKTLSLDVGTAEVRSAALAQIAFGDKNLVWICCTHLDHISEATRLEQWAMLQKELPPAHLLCGDLNALSKADYYKAAWNEIEKVRLENHWEPPVHELLDKIMALGYRDSWTHGDNLGAPPTTSRFATRIDYMLASRAFPGQFVPRSHASVDTIGTNLTDHALVHARVQM